VAAVGIAHQSSFSRPTSKFCNSGFRLCMGHSVPVGVALGDAWQHDARRFALLF